MLPYVNEEPNGQVWAELLSQRDENGALKAFTLYSHAAFFFSLGALLYTRRPYEAVLNAMAFLTSLFYHTCLSFDRCMGVSVFVWRSKRLHYGEFCKSSSLSVCWQACAADASGPMATGARPDFLKVFVPFQIVAVSFAVVVAPYSFYIAYVGLAAALVATMAYPLFFAARSSASSFPARAFPIEPLSVSMPWVRRLFAVGGNRPRVLLDQRRLVMASFGMARLCGRSPLASWPWPSGTRRRCHRPWARWAWPWCTTSRVGRSTQNGRPSACSAILGRPLGPAAAKRDLLWLSKPTVYNCLE